MLNLKYDVPQDKLDTQIMDLIRKDRKLVQKKAIVLGVSSKTIKCHIKEMLCSAIYRNLLWR